MNRINKMGVVVRHCVTQSRTRCGTTGGENFARGHGRICSIALFVLCLCAVSTHAAVDSVETNYTWDSGLEGWTNVYTKAKLTNPGGYLNMKFNTQWTFPAFESDYVGTQVEPGIIYTNFSFAINALNTQPSIVWLGFHSSVSGNMWSHSIVMGPAGEWSTNSIRVSFQDGWAAGSRTSEAQFNEDIQSVDWVGIFICRNGSLTAQNYQLDDFKIQGYTNSVPVELPADSDGDGMTDEWEIANGLDPNLVDDASIDSDGDGITNYGEYLAGTDPHNANSTFKLEPSSSNKVEAVDGFILQWNSMTDRVYNVWRTTNFTEGFSLHGSAIPGTPPVNVYHDKTATNGGPYFYKIDVNAVGP